MQIGGKLANRYRRGPRRKGGFSTCKYCYNSAIQIKGKYQGRCSECAGRSKEENKLRLKCLFANEVLHGLLDQSNISKKNIKFLKTLSDFPDEQVRTFAEVVLEIAVLVPRKKKRYRRIKNEHQALWQKIKARDEFYWIAIARQHLYDDEDWYCELEDDWPFELLDELYDLHCQLVEFFEPRMDANERDSGLAGGR